MQSAESNNHVNHVQNPEAVVVHSKTLEKKPSFASNTMRQVSKKFKRLASTAATNSFDQTKQVAVFVLKKLRFIGKSDSCTAWVDVEKQFQRLTSKTNGLLYRSDFGDCIGMRKEAKEFACKLFDALARKRNISGDFITKAQLKEFWDQIVDQGDQSRLQTFFDLIDENADGSITEDEIREIIIMSGCANKLPNVEEHADEYAKLIMEALDPNNLGYITRQSLETLVESVKDCEEEQNMTKTPSHRLSPPRSLIRLWRETEYFLLDNWQRIWVMALWIGAMSGLFAYKYVQYKHKAAFKVMGHCLCVAKGAAETLKLNMALILLPVCRNTITWLRNKTGLGVVVPFDDNMNFHQLIGLAVAVATAIHMITHLACDYPRILHASPEKFEPLLQYFKKQPTSYWQFLKDWEGVTGVAMVFVMTIVFTLASSWFRRYIIADHHRHRLQSKKKDDNLLHKLMEKLRGFNVFWYTHHLFIIVYALLIIHGLKLYLTKEWYHKTTWMYIAVSVVLYACERLIRLFRSNIEAVKIIKADVHQKEVLTLHMSKPHGFQYKSGQYIFIKCAAISPFEWHPFSITSSPGDDFISVHIRSVGDWTRKIKSIFSDVCKQRNGDQKGDGLFEDDCLHGEDNPNYPKIHIDGPYGAPTQDYKKYEVVLLVGLGIGATPMISVLKDIVHNLKTLDEQDLNLLEQGSGHHHHHQEKISCSCSSTHNDEFETTRAYFYWVAREQSFFDWFKGVMNEVEETHHRGVIEMHNYCASVYEEGDVRSALITMIQSINHAKSGVDIVSRTKVKSYFAKPDWRLVFKDIVKKHPDTRVGVFYCGAPQAAKVLRKLSHEFSHKTNTKFDFHKENF